MSLGNVYWGGRGQCPKCGRFVGRILGTVSEAIGLVKVEGICKTHGEVDLTEQDWSHDDFVRDEEEERNG
jgi:hypothetical protein